MGAGGGVRYESSGNQPTRFDRRPVRTVCSFFGVWMTIERKNLGANTADISRSAQIRDIEASFDSCAVNFDLSSLKHPNKPNITPVGSYEIFPTSKFGQRRTISSNFQSGRERDIPTCAFQPTGRYDSTTPAPVFPLRSTTSNRIVLLRG